MSAERRWFWRVPCAGLREWFIDATKHGDCPAGGGAARVDAYELGMPSYIGVKRRGHADSAKKSVVEVKGLVAVIAQPDDSAGAAPPVEIWCKWRMPDWRGSTAGSVAITKRRWLRKFDTSRGEVSEITLDGAECPVDARPLPKFGCNVEMTSIVLPNSAEWWTFGVESFGSASSIVQTVGQVAHELAARGMPTLDSTTSMSYPQWLQGLSDRVAT